ncbi:MAG TPA: UDP-N-acetylglucosamine 2-epimerase (non-hydrolyzing) [Gemmatimonas aurantiaca]|uniref:UDP-N-acetylglucosamine 2-epimerase (non-hydrolyzing) n=2 Tax=Gemmatimonas aurantiaca TaxID=173480 RepID=C1A6Q0_GEMAT|nr:UDP-N-acetylglucosamine 2-epimerase (non-hydrolyzing) [Gemmatimonas aurantiaca]BAH37910.1 UDP-N-acetylglucosamine 2-epimerase [Gemmatimonas aurantiaca T-27]HCT56687.1 UDP-N-acetylglucosamine 2-epimerase (non-hydrolyzing) [Gemmatimonas aurantiaca]
MSVAPALHKVCIVIGTRPEAIKMAPVVKAVQAHPFLTPLVVATTQHREMLRQALDVFGIEPDIDLGLMQNGQNLGVFTARAMAALTECFLEHRPDFLLVQGDTSTVTAACLAGFYQGIPIGHIEAGLRSFDLSSPFPEEVNRRVATCTANVHFAPTNEARNNLIAEGIPDGDIYVTGNTVVDALHMVPPRAQFDTPALNAIPWSEGRVLLTTVHRRESLGDHLEAICDALEAIVTQHERVEIAFPVHLNPRVRDVVFARLGKTPRIHLLDPLPYPELLELIRRSHFVLSDSGGIQEEVPSFGKPILILRDTTERPEVVHAGFGELVGTDTQTILSRTSALLNDPALYQARSSGQNPFGDGHAAKRIADVIDTLLRSPQDRRGPRRLDHQQVNATLERLSVGL